MKIIFMGTPDFAVPALDALHHSEIEVAAVITAPDKQAGRGRKIRVSAVKQYAVDNDLAVLQPTNLKDPEFVSGLKSLNADLFVVVAFRMLPEVVWKMPSKGTINLHASLLPDYRGAAPINWAIINGDTETGLTTFYINEKIDTGSIIYQEKLEIGINDKVGHIHDKMMVIGAGLLLKTVRDIRDSKAPSIEQHYNDTYKEAPKLNKDNTRINFNETVSSVLNLIRGLSPYPTAYSKLNMDGQFLNVKFFDAQASESGHDLKPGELSTDGKKQLLVGCKDGALAIAELQVEGKKRMKIGELLNGFKLDKTAYFG